MQRQPLRPNMALALIGFSVLFGALLFCASSIQKESSEFWKVSGAFPYTAVANERPAGLAALASTPVPEAADVQDPPTPDPARQLPPLRQEEDVHYVARGETLNQIARAYGVPLQLLISANNLANPDVIEVGQMLKIPVASPQPQGSDFKIIPDSELVNSPATANFDLTSFINAQGGYLASHREEVEDVNQTGAQIIARVARDYSINPRLLLAILEYQSGWVTQANPPAESMTFPIGLQDNYRQGLYFQLAWTANSLNRGYYIWRANGAGGWITADGNLVPVAPTINAGTAGVQSMFSELMGVDAWRQAISPDGLYSTYTRLFGNPFALAVEPLVPPDLQQPPMQLPFEAGRDWAFTGGPHGGWGEGSAWAALDFAPPSETMGCIQSNEWVAAVADGLIVRSEGGAVVQDLDGDGLEQTGWTVLYMHIETRQRVPAGTYVKAGEYIGHPSCEGGVSTGTHVHLARRYNGEWIAADQNIPFNLDGWVSTGDGNEYNGYLTRAGQSLEAYAGRSPNNNIAR